MKTQITEAMSEVLEALWTSEERGSEPPMEVADEVLQALRDKGLVATDGSNELRLLPGGRALAEQIIRRHRLAERLICDVLGSPVDESEDAACEFEHLLAEGITNSICTLLGHPRFCPHNRPIPEGECCRHSREEVKPIVVACDQLAIGESARIAYLCTREHALLRKLSALGITPGAVVKLLQKWPAYVVQCDETEIALEAAVARNIYVWQTPSE
ncbi:MAG TPA: metal-dependent transcriptional regulator [Acidobacteriota bacterium]|nr:metal-dependent transcriptional regulator [Acidobacteriota bacterium]